MTMMTTPTRTGWLVLLLLPWAINGQQRVDQATFTEGAITSALSSAPSLTWSAAKAADQNPTTGWVSGDDGGEVWWRLEWWQAVTIEQLVITPWTAAPQSEVEPLGDFRCEVPTNDGWRTISTGQASDQPVTIDLPTPVITRALRLVTEVSPGHCVAIAEVQCNGPKRPLPQDYERLWRSAWIWVEPSLVVGQTQPLTCYLRRSFRIDEPGSLASAWLVAAAFDRARVWLNAEPLCEQPPYGNGVLPEPQVTAIPVERLKPGENVLAVQVDDLYEAGSHGLLAELVLVGKDGTRTVIGTDGEWLGEVDRGVVPGWLNAGFAASGWVKTTTGVRPYNRWHWLWNVPRPQVAAPDHVVLTAAEQVPQGLKLSFETTAPLTADYAAIVRLGQRSWWRNHDYDLGGGVVVPEELKTTAWKPGAHEVIVPFELPLRRPDPLPVTITLTTPEQAVEMACRVSSWTNDGYGVHGSLPVVPAPLAATPIAFPTCEVKDHRGTATLFVNGAPQPAIWWASSYGSYQRYAAYGTSGIHCFRPLVEANVIAAPGSESTYHAWLSREVERVIDAIVACDPDALVMPVLQMDPNPAWLFDHPAEQYVSGRGQRMIPLGLQVPDRGQVRPTFMSTAWRKAGADALGQLVNALKARPAARHLMGFWFVAGRAGENYWGGNELNLFFNEQGRYDAKPREQWSEGDFSFAARRTFRGFLNRKYGTDEALADAWRRPGTTLDSVLDPAALPREEMVDTLVGVGAPADESVRNPLAEGIGTLPMDYFQCYSEAMLDSFAAWGQAVKEASASRLLTGCYYGYAIPRLWTSLPHFSGHTAIRQAAATPWLDGFSSPIDYERRRAGTACQPFQIGDSLRLHGKLCVNEFDSRTFLAEAMPKTFSKRETLAVFQRDVAQAICRGSGWWWYEFSHDQRGAAARPWFDDPDILEFAGRAKAVAEQAMQEEDRGPGSEIAVFYHPESTTAQQLFPPSIAINTALGNLTLCDSLPKCGAPYDTFLLSDIPKLAETGRLQRVKLAIMLDPFCLDAEARGWVETLKSDGRTLVWLYAPGLAQLEPAGYGIEQVAALTGLPGLRLRHGTALPVARIDTDSLPGLPRPHELAPIVFGKGATWERFGNEVGPVLYVDPAAKDAGTQVLGQWVLDGQPQPDMAALATRSMDDWRTVWCALPYLSPELIRSLAHLAGAHVWRETNGLLYAGGPFVALHTGPQPATGALKLPRPSPVYDVFAERQVSAAPVGEVMVDVPAYATVLYYLGVPE